GLPKPRYVPQAGLLVATTADLLRQAEREGARIERLQQLPGRTALGPVFLARVLRPGRIVIAGPTLLSNLCSSLDLLPALGVRLSIIDGAINRLGAAAPGVTGACILCTGASAAATPELVARRTADLLARLTIQQTQWTEAWKQQDPQARLYMFTTGDKGSAIEHFSGSAGPVNEARWIVRQMQAHRQPAFALHGAFTGELSQALLAQLSTSSSYSHAEFIVEDGTRIFCHSIVLQRLSARGLDIQVARPIRVLALTMNPSTPEYACTPQRLLDALVRELPPGHPPIIDVVSGTTSVRTA
ncbi:MAG TPA: hypothetical protein VKB35_14340, partial [Ktedonobacteraceae bacterium]|nr:hypothetical protein [Ktedonobacteraceae bacterium]